MEKSSIIKIGLGVAGALLLLFFYLNADRSPIYNWNPHFRGDSKDPYGSYLLHELLRSGRDDESFIELNGPLHHLLADVEDTAANYFFVGNNWYFDPDDLLTLTDFVAQGNHAYILANEAPYDIINYTDAIVPAYFGTFLDSLVTMTVKSGNDFVEVECKFIEDWKSQTYFWSYADSTEEAEIYPLGLIDGNQLNYFRVDYGSGSLYFHLTPMVFTNYHLREEGKLLYANKVFDQMKSGTIYWDNFSHLPYDDSVSEDSQSPLSFLLSKESLRWAWYILLACALVYLIFYTRRRQRAIPVTQSVANTSLQFVKTIGGMYYQQEAHLQIIRHQYQLFLTFIRTQYAIATNNLDEDFLKKVSLKSGVDEKSIDFILKEAARLEKLNNVTTKDLVEYNQLTETFYGNCK